MNAVGVPSRELTAQERAFTEYMLKNFCDAPDPYLQQLSRAKVSLERCPCGCASFDFVYDGVEEGIAHLGMIIIADCLFGPEALPHGVMAFQTNGILAGVEFYAFGENAAKVIPPAEVLLLAIYSKAG